MYYVKAVSMELFNTELLLPLILQLCILNYHHKMTCNPDFNMINKNHFKIKVFISQVTMYRKKIAIHKILKTIY